VRRAHATLARPVHQRCSWSNSEIASVGVCCLQPCSMWPCLWQSQESNSAYTCVRTRCYVHTLFCAHTVMCTHSYAETRLCTHMHARTHTDKHTQKNKYKQTNEMHAHTSSSRMWCSDSGRSFAGPLLSLLLLPARIRPQVLFPLFKLGVRCMVSLLL